MYAINADLGRSWKHVAIAGANGDGSATVSEEEAEANARLIAAAPELFDCLVDLLERAEQVEEDLTGPADKSYFAASLIAKCRGVIAKAKGE